MHSRLSPSRSARRAPRSPDSTPRRSGRLITPPPVSSPLRRSGRKDAGSDNDFDDEADGWTLEPELDGDESASNQEESG